MGIWQKLFGREEKAEAIDTSRDLAEYLSLMGAISAAGIRVNPRSAMKCHAVAASVKVLSESVAQLPINVYNIGSDGGRKTADIPLQKIISTHGRPNGWQSSFELREWAVRHIALGGNAYFFKNMVRGQLRELLPIHPRRVTVEQDDNYNIFYTVHLKDGTTQEFTTKQILHLRGPSDDSYLGDDVVVQHADTIGLAMAQEKFASVMFSNGVKNSGTLQHPGKMSQEAFKRLKESFAEQYAGLENAHKPIILEEGVKWETTSQTFEESQLLDSRKYQRSVIAAIWRCPPHMIGDLEKATFSNIENLARQFVDYVLMPWLTRIEQSEQLQLMTDEERSSHQIKFNANALLRGDAKSRGELYNKLYTISAMNPNEIRELEDMNRYDGGDEFARQQNMAPVTDDPEEDTTDEEFAPAE